MNLIRFGKYAILMTTIVFINIVRADSPAVNKNDSAHQACADKEKGDVCDFVNSSGSSVNGNCVPGPNGILSCVAH